VSAPAPSVEQHLATVLAAVEPLPALPVALADAHGCLLGEDVVAPDALPAGDTATLDGYAIRVSDVTAATPGAPVLLTVVGDSSPGAPRAPLAVQPGCAVRVWAGAPLPPGTEAVVPAVWTDGGAARVAVLQAPPVDGWIRRAGSEVAAGSVVASRGVTLGPALLGLLSAVGRTQAVVRPRPRVVVVATGRGIVEAGLPIGAGQVSDSGTHALAAACREAGAVAFRVGVLPEDPRRLLDALEDHLIRADLVLATGGAGGARAGGGGDVVAEVLARIGTVTTSRVAIQPGGTFTVGRVGPDRTPFIGLPGHPMAALVGFELFVRPALRQALGLPPTTHPHLAVTTTTPLASPEGVRSYVPVRLEGTLATTTAVAGIHPLGMLASATALAVIPESVTQVPAGGALEAILLDRRQS
jgi:molybdopterin molybdotransferase